MKATKVYNNKDNHQLRRVHIKIQEASLVFTRLSKGALNMKKNKDKVNERKEQLIKLTTEFSKQYLNNEYEVVIEKLINKMARKREVPFVRGRIDIWAAAIVHAIGSINFLFDKSTEPYCSASDIYEFFNTNQSTTSQRSKQIRDMFKMGYFDSEFSTNTNDQNNPFNSLSMVDGFIVPNHMIEQVQVPETIELDDWELEIAQILGVSTFNKGKKYNMHEVIEKLEVNDRNLLTFFDYLDHHLTFPFRASFPVEAGLFGTITTKVDCLGLFQKMKVHDLYGILVECRMGREKHLRPLAEIELEEDHINFHLVDLYQTWFWNYL